MRVIIIYIFFQTLFFGSLFSQDKTADFNLKIPQNTIQHSYYRSIKIIDQRVDTSNMGFISITINVRNNTVLVKPKVSLEEQLQNIINRTFNSFDDGELLLQIRKIRFRQRPENYEENALFFFRANLYSKEKNGYNTLAEIDTLLLFPYTEPSESIRSKAGDMITNFVLNNISVKSTLNEQLSYFEITKKDSIEKSKIQAYCVKSFKDGIYTNYASFKQQQPDHLFTEVFYNENRVKIKSPGGKRIRLKPESIYAIVEHGKALISAQYGFYDLKFSNTDFYFIGKGDVPRTSAEILLAGLQFGIMAPVMLNSPKTMYFETKIDHIDGTFMRGKKVDPN